MDFSAAHISFVLASYGITILVLGGLIYWHLAKAKTARKQLHLLEDEGTPRRRTSEVKQQA